MCIRDRYTLPLEGSLEIRQSFLRELFQKYSIPQDIKIFLINAEIWAAKFNIMTKIPSYVLQKSTRDFNWFNVLELEFCLVSDKILEEAIKIYDSSQRSTTESEDQFNILSKDGKILTEEISILKSRMQDLKRKNFSEIQTIGNLLITQLRKNLIGIWTKKFNKRKKIDLKDITWNIKGIQNLVEDILIMFKYVLPLSLIHI